MINRVVLAGRLTKDPELKQFENGSCIATFTVAVDNSRKGKDGNRGTCFMNVIVFGPQAENVKKFTKKGSLVGVDGGLNQRNYQRTDGSKGTAIEIIADSVTFLDRKGEGISSAIDGAMDEYGGGLKVAQPEPEVSNADSIDLPALDDLPF